VDFGLYVAAAQHPQLADSSLDRHADEESGRVLSNADSSRDDALGTGSMLVAVGSVVYNTMEVFGTIQVRHSGSFIYIIILNVMLFLFFMALRYNFPGPNRRRVRVTVGSVGGVRCLSHGAERSPLDPVQARRIWFILFIDVF
jgi:hypothetical protein